MNVALSTTCRLEKPVKIVLLCKYRIKIFVSLNNCFDLENLSFVWYLKKRNHPPEALSAFRFGKENSEYLKFCFVLYIKTARNLKILHEKTKGNVMIFFGMNPVKGLTVLLRL